MTQTNLDKELALKALMQADLEWVTHIKRIWQPPIGDVPELHQKAKRKLYTSIDRLNADTSIESPLGIPLLGPGGVGKTHLLRVVRQHAYERGMGFVLVDMTDVHDFWETVVQGYISSLLEAEPDGKTQLEKIVQAIFNLSGKKIPASKVADLSVSELPKAIDVALKILHKKYRKETTKYRECIRATILYHSSDFAISEVGGNWLQGIEIEEGEKKQFGFASQAPDPIDIAEGLSWLGSLRGGTMLALDQLDAIVAQAHSEEAAENDEQKASQSIILGIGGGLTGLRGRMAKTLVVLSCLEASWELLRSRVVSTCVDRYEDPLVLSGSFSASVYSQMVAARLDPTYKKLGFRPPYPTYPFSPTFFEQNAGILPRQLLQRCNKHREQCLEQGQIEEIGGVKPPVISPSRFDNSLDRKYTELLKSVDIEDLHSEGNENLVLDPFLEKLCAYLLKENVLPETISPQLDCDFPGGRDLPPLHARLRLIFHAENDREKHLCFRGIQRVNARAFQARLKSAITASGIDRKLGFRKLAIVRTTKLPGGAVTSKLIDRLKESGGLFWHPSDREIATVKALMEMEQEPHFTQWLRTKKPVSNLPGLSEAIEWFFAGIDIEGSAATGDSLNGAVASDVDGAVTELESILDLDFSQDSKSIDEVVPLPKATTPTKGPLPDETRILPPGHFPIGARLIGKSTGNAVSLPVTDLTKHTVILAGSGSGKTVLLKRVVEEVSLLGIPAIVIDCANDLARLGTPWPTTPESWTPQDDQKASQYFEQTEVVVWTPGKNSGNPVFLEPLPDFTAVRGDADELEQACNMARDSLQDIVAPGSTVAAKLKKGVLKSALLYFAQYGSGNLEDFIELLSDLPEEASGDIDKAAKKASDMANLLRAELANNPLLRQSGTSLDPSVLLGLGTDKTRISVLNFIGLSGLESQQQFLNQLAMTLFTWIKKNPAPANSPIRGLLIIDEAKDFIPSQKNTACKASIIRLAAQARKYGLGLIFATQSPKSIDNNIIANCTTQFFGRASSPAAIDVVRSQLQLRGGSGEDIPKLRAGQFYATSEELNPPAKIKAPLCLSYHASTPFGETEVLKLAEQSRKSLSADLPAVKKKDLTSSAISKKVEPPATSENRPGTKFIGFEEGWKKIKRQGDLHVSKEQFLAQMNGLLAYHLPNKFTKIYCQGKALLCYVQKSWHSVNVIPKDDIGNGWEELDFLNHNPRHTTPFFLYPKSKGDEVSLLGQYHWDLNLMCVEVGDGDGQVQWMVLTSPGREPFGEVDIRKMERYLEDPAINLSEDNTSEMSEILISREKMGLGDITSGLAKVVEDAHGEPIQLISWHRESEKRIATVFRDRNRGTYLETLIVGEAGRWSSERRELPEFSPLCHPDIRTWMELTEKATAEDWLAIDEIVLSALTFQGSELILAGPSLIGEEVAEEAMERFGVYIPDDDLLPAFVFENRSLGVSLLSYFKHEDGFAKENLLADANTEQCIVLRSLREAQIELDRKLNYYQEES